MDDFIGELLDRIDASGQSFSQRAYEALSQDLEPLLRLLFMLAVLFYGLQLFLGTSRLSVAEIIGRLVRVFVILILVGTWSNFNDLVYDWLTTVPEAAGRAILAASGTGVTEPTNGLSQIWKTANTAAAAFSEQAGYLSVLPALIGMIIMVFAGLFVAIALGILVLAKVVLWVLLGTAPIFIACFFFDATRSYAMGWLNQSPALRDHPALCVRDRGVPDRGDGARVDRHRQHLQRSRAEAERFRCLHHALPGRQFRSSTGAVTRSGHSWRPGDAGRSSFPADDGPEHFLGP